MKKIYLENEIWTSVRTKKGRKKKKKQDIDWLVEENNTLRISIQASWYLTRNVTQYQIVIL
mgnify:CR=1 FL=1